MTPQPAASSRRWSSRRWSSRPRCPWPSRRSPGTGRSRPPSRRIPEDANPRGCDTGNLNSIKRPTPSAARPAGGVVAFHRPRRLQSSTAGSPTTVTVIRRRWGLVRCSQRKMPCQVPRSHRPDVDRDRQRGEGQDRPDVRGHVVRPFAVVDVGGIAVRRQPRRVTLQVAPDGRVGVLADDQRRARVMDEHVAEALVDARAFHDLLHLSGDLVGPAPRVSMVSFWWNISRLRVPVAGPTRWPSGSTARCRQSPMMAARTPR